MAKTKLPAKRDSCNAKVKFLGNKSLYATVTYVTEEGKGKEKGSLIVLPMEVFLSFGKEGTEMGALLSAIGMIMSIALQSGTSLRDILGALGEFGEKEVPYKIREVIAKAIEGILDIEAEKDKARYEAAKNKDRRGEKL